MFKRVGIVMVMFTAGFGAAVGQSESLTDNRYPILELRQYTLHPGQRDVLITLFDREFVEPQEALGIKLIGQFRDLDNPDRFVWLRAFRDMESRPGALNALYTGPVWQAHRNTANATMIDSDNVFLLRAPEPEAAFGQQPARPPAGAASTEGRFIVATIYPLRGDLDGAAQFFAREMMPQLRAADIEILGYFVSEQTPNNFPALPVRENEPVLVWFSRFETPAQHRARMDALAAAPAWTSLIPRLEALLARPPETLRLQPTARSELR